MAEQKATSRTLDYRLGEGTMDRLKAAGRAEHFDSEGKYYGSQLGEQIGAVGEKLYEYGKVKEKKQQKKDQLDVAWENSYDTLGNRGSWASPALYDKFQDLELGFKEQYLAAVDNNDIKQQNKLLRDQEMRSSSLMAWKEAVTMNTDVMGAEGTGYSNALSDEDKNILTQLNAQEDPQIQINPKTNELEFIIQGLDGKPQTVGLGQLNKIVEMNMPPTAITSELTLGNKVLEKYGEEGKKWDDKVNGSVMAANKKSIKKVKNIATMFYDDFTDTNTTFAEDIKNHPDFSYYNLSYDTLGIDASVLDKDGDGKISGNEQAALTSEDIDKIIQHMSLPENRNIAEEYLAEYMTLKQKAYYERGYSTYSGEAHNKSSKSNKSDHQNKVDDANKKLNQQKNKNVIDKNVVVDNTYIVSGEDADKLFKQNFQQPKKLPYIHESYTDPVLQQIKKNQLVNIPGVTDIYNK